MKIGIICNMDYKRSIVIENYYYAIKNLYPDLKIITKPSDAADFDIIFIGNDHFSYHVAIWNTDEFINICNNKNIKVIVIGGEKVHNTVYVHNIPYQNRIRQIKNIKYYMWDVEDVEITGDPIIGYAVSSYYKNKIPVGSKLNKCIFIGQINEKHYQDRRNALGEISKYIDIDVISSADFGARSTNKQDSWQEYIETIAKYKFIFSPRSGTSDSIPFRFYEGLLVNTIPIQQVTDKTLLHHPMEAAIPECIFFKHINELQNKFNNYSYERCNTELWFEDKIKNQLLKDEIYVP